MMVVEDDCVDWGGVIGRGGGSIVATPPLL